MHCDPAYAGMACALAGLESAEDSGVAFPDIASDGWQHRHSEQVATLVTVGSTVALPMRDTGGTVTAPFGPRNWCGFA